MTEKAAAQSIARQLRENAAWLRKGPTGLGDDVDPDSKRMAGLMEQAAALLSSPSAAPAELVAYCPAYELDRLKSGHDARIRSARFGPSRLDGDVPLYAIPAPSQLNDQQEGR